MSRMVQGLRGAFALSLLACATLGCAGGQTGSEGSIDGRSEVCAPASTVMCGADSECRQNADAMLAALRPTETGGPRELVAAECNHELSCDGSPLCLCHIERDGAPASGIALGGNGCALRGRSLACLWPAAELTACRPGSCDCAYACTRAIALADADDARVPATEIRLARCVDNVCRYAFAIDDRCYAGTPEPRHEVDCALSDAEVLQASSENAVEPGSCNDARSCASRSPAQQPDPDVASCVGEQSNGVTDR